MLFHGYMVSKRSVAEFTCIRFRRCPHRACSGTRGERGESGRCRAGVYASNSVKAGERGVGVKSMRKTGGALDAHGARSQCVFVYRSDNEPAMDR